MSKLTKGNRLPALFTIFGLSGIPIIYFNHEAHPNLVMFGTLVIVIFMLLALLTVEDEHGSIIGRERN